MKNKVVVIYKEVEERRVMIEVKCGEDVFKVEEMVVKFRVIGIVFKVICGCF